MSRCKEAPIGFECPYRHKCPHLDSLSTTWVMEVYQEAYELRRQLHALELDSARRIEELQKALLERDQTIAQLRLQHQKQFKANAKKPKTIPVTTRRRGAPRGHPPWRRREPDHIDQVVNVPAPRVCPHCQCQDLEPCPDVHEHVQEDIVLAPRTRVVKYVHGQAHCPICRRAVSQKAEGELPGCCIGPVTRAVAAHLRYDLQIPYRKVQHLLQDLFGMPLVPATAMNFDRKTTALGRPLFEELRVMLRSSAVAYADETTWREDGKGTYLWFGGNEHIAVYQIADRSGESAVKLLGEDFGGALITDDYSSYNAVGARNRQTCWNHLRTKAKEIIKQIELTDPPISAPRSIAFCKTLRRFAVEMCALGRKQRGAKQRGAKQRGAKQCGRKLSLARARAMIPALNKRLKRFGGKPLEHEAAETLRKRVMVKDRDKLFTFLRVKGVEPTNNHAERSLRFLVIMRKICFGTRGPAGSESHGVLPSLLQTARRQGKDAIQFLVTLLTQPKAAAKAALFSGGP
jgi:transposase